MRKYAYGLAAGVACAALATSWLWAQPVIQNTFTGLECWEVGQGPGGPGTYACSQSFRGSTNNLPLTATGSWTMGATSANTTPNNTATLVYGGSVLYTANPSGPPTITLPPNPLTDGTIVAVCNTTSGAFTTGGSVTANTGQTLSGGNISITTLAAFTCVVAQWNLANATWYRIR
jgi:hypothetical protein